MKFVYIAILGMMLSACGGSGGGSAPNPTPADTGSGTVDPQPTPDPTPDPMPDPEPTPDPTPDPQPIPEPDSFELEVRFLLDGFGKSRLYIQGNSLWWQNINGIAPGLIDAEPSATHLNNVMWYPEWPESGKNAFCACDSSTAELHIPSITTDIAVDDSQITPEEVRILQQTSDTGDMTIVIEIENRSSVAMWKTIVIKDILSATSDDIVAVTAVDDLDEPKVDEEAKKEYEEVAGPRARLNEVLAENVELQVPAPYTGFLSRNEVSKRTWVLAMSEELPAAFCATTQYFNRCYNVTRSECITVATNKTKLCLNESNDLFPDPFVQPGDGSNWGGIIGGCAQLEYENALAEWKIPGCSN